jgi:hypothetical protein
MTLWAANGTAVNARDCGVRKRNCSQRAGDAPGADVSAHWAALDLDIQSLYFLVQSRQRNA